MKIGILTYHNAYNYGAVLQTYATQEILKLMGHKAVVIDYHNKAVDLDYEKRKFCLEGFWKSGIRFPLYLIEKTFYRKRRNEYHRFGSKYIELSKESYYQGEKISFDDYDAILIGSDQLWNKKITGGLDEVYWGHFERRNETKVISWSVCMNNLDLNADEITYIKDSLSQFSAISVREDNLQAFIAPLANKTVFHTSDPTLVLPSHKWEELCQPVKEKNYIAVYAVREGWKTIEFARKVARLTQKRLVIISAYSGWKVSREYKECLGPIGFISYLNSADLVITSSFHGTAFSILFKKNFVIPLFEENVRIQSLLKSYSLTDRIVHSPEEVVNLNPIDYKTIKPIINRLKNESEDFLRKVLA